MNREDSRERGGGGREWVKREGEGEEGGREGGGRERGRNLTFYILYQFCNGVELESTEIYIRLMIYSSSYLITFFCHFCSLQELCVMSIYHELCLLTQA